MLEKALLEGDVPRALRIVRGGQALTVEQDEIAQARECKARRD